MAALQKGFLLTFILSVQCEERKPKFTRDLYFAWCFACITSSKILTTTNEIGIIAIFQKLRICSMSHSQIHSQI